jgi:DNA-binding transcriptional regulator YiaG
MTMMLIAVPRRRALRVSAGLTLSEVGRLCGVKTQTVHYWEVENRQPRGEAGTRYDALIDKWAAELIVTP